MQQLIMVFLLPVVKLSAYSPIIVPEWSFTINSKPTHMILYDMESDRLAEIAVIKTPNQLMLLSNTGDSILWTFQVRSLLKNLTVLERPGLNPMLIVASDLDIIALDNLGKTIWQLLVPDFKNKSINWLVTGNLDQNPGNEIIAISGNLVCIISTQGKIIRKFTTPIFPKQIEIGNIDNDIYEEIVISDFKKIITLETNGSINSEITLSLLDNQINQGFDLYDINLDRIEEIVAITQDFTESAENKIENQVSCFANAKIIWQTKESAGTPRSIKIVRGETYTIGSSLLGRDYITKRDRAGKIIKTIYSSNTEPPLILTSPSAKFSQNPTSFQKIFPVGHLILIGMGWFEEAEQSYITKLHLFSSPLNEIDLTTPEYFSDTRFIVSDRNQRLLDFQIGSINGDTLADIILTREQGYGKYAIDCLVNRLDISYRTEIELWDDFRSALLSGNQNQAARYRWQAKIIAAGLGDTITAVVMENSVRREWRRRLEGAAVRSIIIAFLIVSVLGGFGIIVVRPLIRNRISRKSRLEVKSVPNIVKIATDVIALDHNYVVKGNLGGAYNRLNEIIEKYGLQADIDLKLVWQKSQAIESTAGTKISQENFLIPYYRFIKRVANDTRKVNLISIIRKICNNVIGVSNPISELALNRNEYRPGKVLKRTEPGNRGLSVSFIYLFNRDFPEIYNTAQFFWSSQLYNWFEHICMDHLRYAKNFAHFVFDYETATEWSRKMVLHLVSDSDKNINYNQKESHLLAEVDELKTDFQDYILISDDERVLYYPGEKIWVKIIDLLSILSTIIGQSKIA